jgi:hypothetical protein
MPVFSAMIKPKMQKLVGFYRNCAEKNADKFRTGYRSTPCQRPFARRGCGSGDDANSPPFLSSAQVLT